MAEFLPDNYQDPYKNFSALSFHDLVEARDFYHRQLMRKRNVVGTALGRFLFRREGTPQKAPKTFANSAIRKFSWPCILVLVDQWIPDQDFGTSVKIENYIPPSIEMPDGRVIPVCVVEAKLEPAPPVTPLTPKFPDNWIGGGYPVIADVQGAQHIASIGGLLTDGHLTYALTNRHVTGKAGEIVYSVLGGEKTEIGVSSELQISRAKFEEVYPEWPGKDVFVQMDIGLIEVHDLKKWTAQIYGIGAAGPMVDLSTDNLSLRLLDQPLEAFACGTGHMRGRIIGMFYRFKSVSGSEYVADFMIGPDGAHEFSTHHGDSGTLWLMKCDAPQNEPPPLPRPIAVQWGGQIFRAGGSSQEQPFALATCLSTVCRMLNVDFVQDWNTGQPEYWGAVGHYTIAEKACEIIKDPGLKALMQANLASITYPLDQINAKDLEGLSTRNFVPLADVPDMVWKTGPHKRGGMSSPEHANHFADMDKVDSKGQTLLQICEASDKNISPDRWLAYYTDPAIKDGSKGLLPFRCWQIYNEMVNAVKDRDATRFICAAGILSHYVGDSCQPLHISYMFNGDPNDTEMVEVPDKKTGQTKQVKRAVAAGVHSAYEDGLVNFHTPEIQAGLQSTLKGKPHGLPLNKKGGFGAARAVVGLMQQTFNQIQPKAIVDAFVKVRDLKPRDQADHLWQEFGERTVQVMASGARTLAMLWDSAWQEGGATAALGRTGEINQTEFINLYTKPDFLPSCTLVQIGSVLLAPAAGTVATKKKPAALKRARSAGTGK
jgi:hypothetical protein